MTTLITCEHCGREYNADEYLQCPDDAHEAEREELQQLAQQILLLCMQISDRGLADVFFNYSGHVGSLKCYAYPQGVNYQRDPEWPSLFDYHASRFDSIAQALTTFRACHQHLTEMLTAGQVIHIDSLPRTAA